MPYRLTWRQMRTPRSSSSSSSNSSSSSKSKSKSKSKEKSNSNAQQPGRARWQKQQEQRARWLSNVRIYACTPSLPLPSLFSSLIHPAVPPHTPPHLPFPFALPCCTINANTCQRRHLCAPCSAEPTALCSGSAPLSSTLAQPLLTPQHLLNPCAHHLPPAPTCRANADTCRSLLVVSCGAPA